MLSKKYYSLILLYILVAQGTILHAQQTIFAVIGDFGTGNSNETAVANLVKSWNPQFIITTGDDRYYSANYDLTIGKDYCEFLAGAGSGTYCNGNGSSINAFFPSTGNHDYTNGGGINEYLTYFDLPGAGIQTSGTSGSERYYDFIMGPVHFFVIDSYDAITYGSMSAQQTWLEHQMTASTAQWKVVYFHHAAYSSGSQHGSTLAMRWPFAQWGADVVLSGHDHTYERLEYDNIIYFVNGLGGASMVTFSTLLPGSMMHYSDEYGAQRVVVTDTTMNFSFINVDGVTIDEYELHKAVPGNHAPVFSSDPILEDTAIEDSPYFNSIGTYASDPDGDTLRYSIISGPAWLTVTPDGDLSGTPLNEDVGVNSWILEVVDGHLGADTATLSITVLNTNDAPVFSTDTILENMAIEDSLYLSSIGAYASDPDGDLLNFSIISGPAWLTVSSGGEISGTPLNEDVGANIWIVEVDDGHLGADTATLQITVLNTNDAPAFSSDTILEDTAIEDNPYFNFIRLYAYDPDDDILRFSIISGPAWLNLSYNGKLSGTPVYDDIGLNNWIVKVEDGDLGADTATILIMVLGNNQDTTATGYRDHSGSLITVYPNPVTDRLIIEFNGWEGSKELALYDISGKAVFTDLTISERVEINVSPFPKGVYLLEIKDEEITGTRVIIIQ